MVSVSPNFFAFATSRHRCHHFLKSFDVFFERENSSSSLHNTPTPSTTMEPLLLLAYAISLFSCFKNLFVNPLALVVGYKPPCFAAQTA
jgi:hypothetical protein